MQQTNTMIDTFDTKSGGFNAASPTPEILTGIYATPEPAAAPDAAVVRNHQTRELDINSPLSPNEIHRSHCASGALKNRTCRASVADFRSRTGCAYGAVTYRTGCAYGAVTYPATHYQTNHHNEIRKQHMPTTGTGNPS